ncbi:MAG: tetratricopeptide repeat protein [Marinilabiliales bacterium]|nr:MAG: tetratricopeptide repeat protein [Marinilabiliales bacterium]
MKLTSNKLKRFMRESLLLLIVISFTSCDSLNNKKSSIAVLECADNQELIDIFESDQADRTPGNYNRDTINYNDSIREARVYELLEAGKVRTANDYTNAGLIFHHGEDSVAYALAVKLLTKAIEMDTAVNKWFLACATDRYLLSIEKPQIYGTHFKRGEDNIVFRRAFDSTKITDAERIEFGVETLAQQQEKIRRYNRKQLRKYIDEGNSASQLIELIKQQDLQNPEYDISEKSINRAGYLFMYDSEFQSARIIFEQNIAMYPNSANAWDSYGECLFKLGERENAILAYEKSLELNPRNTNAREKLNEIKQ